MSMICLFSESLFCCCCCFSLTSLVLSPPFSGKAGGGSGHRDKARDTGLPHFLHPLSLAGVLAHLQVLVLWRVLVKLWLLVQ